MTDLEIDEMLHAKNYRDPSYVAAELSDIFAERYGLSEKEAMLTVLRSNTFRKILQDRSISKLSNEEILEMYEREDNRWQRD